MGTSKRVRTARESTKFECRGLASLFSSCGENRNARGENKCSRSSSSASFCFAAGTGSNGSRFPGSPVSGARRGERFRLFNNGGESTGDSEFDGGGGRDF